MRLNANKRQVLYEKTGSYSACFNTLNHFFEYDEVETNEVEMNIYITHYKLGGKILFTYNSLTQFLYVDKFIIDKLISSIVGQHCKLKMWEKILKEIIGKDVINILDIAHSGILRP
jgi:hypothetical protein